MEKELEQILKPFDELEDLDKGFALHDFFEGVKNRYPIIKDTKGQQLLHVTSIAFKNTPKSLYRFLYLWEPKNIDFSDMYKSGLAIIRIHKKGVVILSLYKYELVARLFVTSDEIKPRKRYGIEIKSGVPGVDNEGLKADSEVGKEFKIFKGLLEMKHDVYPGNEFKV